MSQQTERAALCATPASSATEAAENGATELAARVRRLAVERDAVILAHYYAPAEVQAVADYVGDSFYLAKLAVELPQQTIVLAGVAFMGESVKLLNPAKTVLLPEPAADCPMAHMVRAETIAAARERWGSDLAVVCYVNSTIAAKAASDVCVTSSNAVKIVRELPEGHVLFIPDRNLGRYVAEQVPEKDVLLNDGCCPRHDAVSVAEVQTLRAAHPEAEVLAHPECTPEVLAEADYIGSTSGIIARAEASEAQEFIVLTVRGVGYELHRRCPGKRFFFPPTPLTCADMDSITLGKVARCLETGEGAVELDASAPASLAAKRALDRMLELAGR